jgi:hypothetical protein
MHEKGRTEYKTKAMRMNKIIKSKIEMGSQKIKNKIKTVSLPLPYYGSAYPSKI